MPTTSSSRTSPSRRGNLAWFLIGGLAVALLLAGVVSYYASSSPDGLEKVAQDKGFGEKAQDSAASGSALADYSVSGVESERLSVGVAGVIGVVVTFAFAGGLFLLVRRKGSGSSTTDEPATTTTTAG